MSTMVPLFHDQDEIHCGGCVGLFGCDNRTGGMHRGAVHYGSNNNEIDTKIFSVLSNDFFHLQFVPHLLCVHVCSDFHHNPQISTEFRNEQQRWKFHHNMSIHLELYQDARLHCSIVNHFYILWVGDNSIIHTNAM